MKIRKATQQDKQQVLRLGKYLYGKEYPKDFKKWQKSWTAQKALVAEDKNRIVAYIYYHVKPHSVYIADLYVLPKYRKRGVATALIKKVESIKRELKKECLRVDVRGQDKPAFMLYSRLGFKKWKRKPKTKASWKLRK